MKWICANGGEWTSATADGAAENGHLETLKWIRANGGECTSAAADGAAANGHLETLKKKKKIFNVIQFVICMVCDQQQPLQLFENDHAPM